MLKYFLFKDNEVIIINCTSIVHVDMLSIAQAAIGNVGKKKCKKKKIIIDYNSHQCVTMFTNITMIQFIAIDVHVCACSTVTAVLFVSK